MADPPSIYADGNLYDLTIDASEDSPIAGDVDFYLELARETGGPVLDLGCGTGRVAIPLAEEGFEVVGIDLEEAMLQTAREGAAGLPATFMRGDMREFDLGRQFGLIVIPFRAFQHLLDHTSQRQCLAAARRHLLPGGRFVVTLFVPYLPYLAERELPHPETQVVHRRRDGSRIERTVSGATHDPLRQLLEETWTHRDRAADGTVRGETTGRLRLRWTYAAEMALLLELAGFAVEACYGDYRRGPLTARSEQIWVCRQPGT